MANPSRNSEVAAASPVSQEDLDRRRHQRVELRLKARVLTAEGSEKPCLVVNISAGGAMLKAKSPPTEGEDIVVYIDEIGRFEGRVIRSAQHFFVVDYRGRRAKSKRTADALTCVLNRAGVRNDRRVHPRIRQEEATFVTLEDGETIACSIQDISLTGASIAIDPRPALGAHLTVGKMAATVVRRHETGVGVVFTGAANRMEEVMEQAKSRTDTPAPGSGLAPQFGRKGLPS